MSTFIVVCYDVSNDRSRLSITHALMGYGVRVQKSVFECLIENPGEIKKLLSQLESYLDEGDSLRVYYFCPKDRTSILCDGGLPPESDEAFVIAE